jgi:energy-coupling factor transporter ATP-binding protein EcfA2
MKNPKLLLLDEPFAALDANGRSIVADSVASLRAEGTTVIIATHRPHVAAPSCDQAIHMTDGRVSWMGAAQEALAMGIST